MPGSSYELKFAAEAQAETFELPADWRVGRGTSHDFAIDDASSRDLDDVVGMSNLGSGVLRVGISDIGSFVAPHYDAVARYAKRQLATVYRGDKAVSPMIPARISEDKMSLLDGVERPVLTVHVPVDAAGKYHMPRITQDVVRARRLTPKDVEDRIDEASPTGTALRGLERMACLLFASRHSMQVSLEDAALEDELGNILTGGNYDTGRLIVQESMIVAGAAMSHFMQANNIPALYRNHVLPDGLQLEGLSPYERSRILGPLAIAGYGIVPLGHAGLNLPSYMHFTSPIRRFTDFANHANLVAFLQGRDYPYPEDKLYDIAERIDDLARREPQPDAPSHHTRRRATSTSVGASAPHRSTRYLMERFSDGSAGPGELATALFNSQGSEADIVAVRQAAAQFAAANIHHARSALNIALMRKSLTLRPAVPEDNLGSAAFALQDSAGNVYPYAIGNPVKVAIRSAKLIGTICGVEVAPIVPEDKTWRGRILKKPYNYLKGLAGGNRLQLTIQLRHEEGELAYAGCLVIIDGEQHTAVANESSKTQALRKACTELITRLDLIDNPPPKPPAPAPPGSKRQLVETKAAQVEQLMRNPIAQLQARQQTAGIEQPLYIFPDVGEDGELIEIEDSFDANGNRQRICTATAADIDGTSYSVRAMGSNRKEAKQNAAAMLFAQMPPRPLKKKEGRQTGSSPEAD